MSANRRPRCLRDEKYDSNMQGPCSSGMCQWPRCKPAATDTERFDFLAQHDAQVCHSRDGDVCWIVTYDYEGNEIAKSKPYSTPREAVDAVIRASRPARDSWEAQTVDTTKQNSDRKDAERYRHLRASGQFQDRNGPGIYFYLPRWDRGLPVCERFDRAIDEEMREVQQRARNGSR